MSQAGETRRQHTSCSCTFHVTMKLPRRHIFLIRELCDLQGFGDTLIDRRWTKEYYLSHHRIFTDIANEVPLCTITQTEHFSAKPLSAQQKYRKTFLVCRQLAQLAAEAGEMEKQAGGTRSSCDSMGRWGRSRSCTKASTQWWMLAGRLSVSTVTTTWDPSVHPGRTSGHSMHVS